MPSKLEVSKTFEARSERVKCVDLHPNEPWILACLYDGSIIVYEYNSGAVIKSFETVEQPVRCGKFIVRKQWIVVGADDLQLRVYNYNTMEKLKTFEAHVDYIRSLAVHPSLPYVLSASDDMLIKLWNWEKGWLNTMVFEGHSHYVMQVVFNSKDPNTFASASLDRTVKVWNISSSVPNFTLEGHEKGVNCLDYFSGADKPYLISGSDDRTVKVTRLQRILCGFPPYDASYYEWLRRRLNFGLERVWSLSYVKGSNKVAFGFDFGTVLAQVGKDRPVASMDSSGRVVIAKHSEILTVNLKSVDSMVITDGERLPIAPKDMGSCEVFPQVMSHSANGRFVAVCGEGEYIIYTALAWRNKAFGSAESFVWDNGAGLYAILESNGRIRVFNKMFKEVKVMKPSYTVEEIFGGALLGVKGSDFVCFYDWNLLQIVRRVDINAKGVFWSDSSEFMAISGPEAFYILRYSRDAVMNAIETNRGQLGEDGVEDAFEVIQEYQDRVASGRWIGDCFLYTTTDGKLKYLVGSEVSTLAHIDSQLILLGYLPSENRAYLLDKECNIISYQLLVSVLEYKLAILRGDEKAADQFLEQIPPSERTKLAHFLESQGWLEKALDLATDPDYRCELAIKLRKLHVAVEIAKQFPSESKWRQITELALSSGDINLTEECMKESGDFSGLLSLYSGKGDIEGVNKVAQMAITSGKLNLAFLCFFLTGETQSCIDTLLKAKRYPEAALFARTYVPSEMTRVAQMWREHLKKEGNIRLSNLIADPVSHPHYFPEYDETLQLERETKSRISSRLQVPPQRWKEYEDDVFVPLSSLLNHMDKLRVTDDLAASTEASIGDDSLLRTDINTEWDTSETNASEEDNHLQNDEM
ncbi:Coatomer subunit beta'-1 [Galdieria sulphuraria]|nr:Coatomer subunit beta'-1 [Galdieria sulphuraria]